MEHNTSLPNLCGSCGIQALASRMTAPAFCEGPACLHDKWQLQANPADVIEDALNRYWRNNG